MFRSATLTLLVSFLLIGSSHAGKDQLVVKLGTVAPEGTPWHKQIARAKNTWKELSKGTIKLKAYTGFAKGGETSLVRRCIQGSIQMCGVTVGALSAIMKDLTVLELPYLFADNAEVDRILDGPALPQIKKILASRGLVFFAWSENGWRSYGTKEKPIRSPADLNGLKVRSMDNMAHVETHKALGASPVPIALPEVLGALQTGVVDGYDNSPLYLFAASWYKYTKYYSLTRHIYQPACILFNKAWFDKQPAETQKILMHDPQGMTDYGRKLIRAIDAPLLKNLQSVGIKIIQMPAAQQALFAKATQGVHKKVRRKLSPMGRKLLDIILRAKKQGK